jgi:hypothetical protein
VPQVKGQQDKRRYEFFIDQHGREYGANIEIDTGDPCETLKAHGWTAPAAPHWAKGILMPPENCLKLVPAKQRARRGYQIEVDYDKWLVMWDEAKERYDAKVHDFARGMTNGTSNIIELVNDPPPVLREIVGPPPSPPRAFIEAARAGNAWALGQSGAVPAKAEAILRELQPIVSKQRVAASHDPLAGDEMEDEAPALAGMAAFLDPMGDAVDEAVSVQPRRRK